MFQNNLQSLLLALYPNYINTEEESSNKILANPIQQHILMTTNHNKIGFTTKMQ